MAADRCPARPLWVSHLAPAAHDAPARRRRPSVRSASASARRCGTATSRCCTSTPTSSTCVRCTAARPPATAARSCPTTGALVLVGAGSAHGVAPLDDGRSPFHFARRRLALLEPPHMHTSMVFVPSRGPVAEVGDRVDLQRPLITTDGRRDRCGGDGDRADRRVRRTPPGRADDAAGTAAARRARRHAGRRADRRRRDELPRLPQRRAHERARRRSASASSTRGTGVLAHTLRGDVRAGRRHGRDADDQPQPAGGDRAAITEPTGGGWCAAGVLLYAGGFVLEWIWQRHDPLLLRRVLHRRRR